VTLRDPGVLELLNAEIPAELTGCAGTWVKHAEATLRVRLRSTGGGGKESGNVRSAPKSTPDED